MKQDLEEEGVDLASLPGDQIFNADETGFQLVGKGKKELAPQWDKYPPRIGSEKSENITGTTSWYKKGNFSKCSIKFCGTYERGLVIIDITMACAISS